jgi:hypothetical protein
LEQERASKFKLGDVAMKKYLLIEKFLVLFALLAMFIVCPFAFGQGAPVSVTNKSLTVTGSFSGPTPVPQFTQIPFPTPIYGPGTPVPVSIQTPVPQFTQIPFPAQNTPVPQFTQLPYQYPASTAVPVVATVPPYFTPVPQFTQIPIPAQNTPVPQFTQLPYQYPASTPAPVSVSNNTSFSEGVTNLPAPVTSGAGVLPLCDVFGRNLNFPYTPRALVKSFFSTIASSTTPVTFIAAGGAGIFNDIEPGAVMSFAVLNNNSVTIIGGGVTLLVTGNTAVGTADAPQIAFPGWEKELTANVPWTMQGNTTDAINFTGYYDINQ